MASMAAMFAIIAIYSYLRGRTGKKIWFFICLLSCLAAVGSKENAVLVPGSLFLIEVTFFRHHFTKRHVALLLAAVTATLLCFFLFVRYGVNINLFSNLLSVLDGYDTRSFALNERILTQPRIVIFYLSQILLPNIGQLSIEHDITLSTSLIAPWTTLPALLIISFLIVASFAFLKKFPLVCFPVLFFFLNHSVESTILPLELIFEHRNYLPSLFLFLPVSVFIAHIIFGSIKLSSFGRTAVIFCATLFLIISGQATYTRNLVWTTEGTLWNDTLRKAPNSPRAAHNLARYYHQLGRYQQAYHYFQRSLENAETAADPKRTKKSSLNALASVAYLLGDQKLAQRHYSQCLNLDKKDEICLKNSTLAYLRSGLPEKALIQAKKLSNEHPVPFDTQFDYPEYQLEYQYLTALAAYQASDQSIALTRIQKIAGRSVGKHQNLYLTGCIMMKEQAYPNALFFLKRANKLSPNNAEYLLSLAEAYHTNKQTVLAEKNIQNVLKMYPLPVVMKMLNKMKRDVLDNNSADFVEYALTLLPHKL
ncbi:MAG: hypothetical protein D3910_14660 [Candidatus Electrothrix sp. ATG2]|nr:hypothetical protein [Candidatus Electrothrix sp. ATG2]